MGSMSLAANRPDVSRRVGEASQVAGPRIAAKEFAWGNWLLAAILAAGTAGYVFFLFFPNQEAIETLRAEFATKQGVVQSTANLASALTELRQRLATVRAHNTAWEQDHPDRSELAALFGQMTALGKPARIRLTRFDPQPIVPHERIATVPLDLEFRGSFSEVFAFLQALEALPHQVWIRSLKMERSGESTKDVTCKISMDVFSDNPKDSDQEDHSG